MNRTDFLVIFFCISAFFQTAIMFGQDKQVELKVEKNVSLFDVFPSGKDEFMLVYGKQLLSKQASKMIMKYNATLEPVWAQPLAFSGVEIGAINAISYTDPPGNKTTTYLFGTEQFIQILPDGTPKEKSTEIPKKEANNTAAVFADAEGLNVITITGDETFPTGSMNWYTYAHDDLSMKKRTISLPLPSGTDRDNESGWRLNEVSDSDLYFTYVSYKNSKDPGGPILACHVIQVDHEGNVGDILNLDLGMERYTIVPADFSMGIHPGVKVFAPEIWNHEFRSSILIYTPTDNAYAGIKIDAGQKRVYTLVALNDKMDDEVNSPGPKSMNALGWSFPVKSLELSVYDLEGNRLSRSTLNNTPTKLAASDDYGYHANKIEILPLPQNEGAVCRFLNNGNGAIWATNAQGEIVHQVKIKPYFYKKMMAPVYNDAFYASYYSMGDFERSPYWGTQTSAVAKLYRGMDEKQKEIGNFFYLSLDSYELTALVDSKNKSIGLAAFAKK